eukprot:919826-Amphidinium_carterae.2
MSLQSDLNSFANYSGFEHDTEAVATVQGYVQRGYLRAYGSMDEARDALGRYPVLSRLGVLIRQREGKVKKRVEATDVVNMVLMTIRHAPPTDAELFICNFSEAFWQIPLHKSDQPYYAGVLKGQ